MQKYVLITAGGTGTRMKAGRPKQFLLLAGKPLILHSVDTFLKYDSNIQFVIVLPELLHHQWEKVCHEYGMHIRYQMVFGGPERFHSVKNGLQYIPDNTLVAVHDAARPLVSLDIIARTYHIAEKFGNAIPVADITDTVRITDHSASSPLPRERIKLVQTPQCFRSELLKKAYNKNYTESFTDDATVLEADGARLYLTEGHSTNIKITTPTDLLIAKALIRSKESAARRL
jgi:2-C-methyl-D-erythritol 4-phosphate cytidylyltransferase